MRRKFFAVLLLGFLSAVGASAVPDVAWRIEVKRDARDDPHSTVDLIVDGKSAFRLIIPEPITSFQVMPPGDYADNRVPAKALCACYSWWAGSGTRFYVVANAKGDLEVYRLEVDEGMTSTPRWHRTRTISRRLRS